MNIINTPHRLIPQRLLISVLAVSTLLAAPPTMADDDAEREKLAKISYELEHIRRMIDDAAKTADKNQRVRFRYDWLNRDIELVQRGIEDHLDSPRQPRPVTVLRGDYRQ
jgi:RAQPRD family integrative conjugative element protein